MTTNRKVHSPVLMGFIVLVGLAFAALRAQQHSIINKSPPRYPTYPGERLENRAGPNGDLRGDIPADRELSQIDLAYLLEIADFLVTKEKRPTLRTRGTRSGIIRASLRNSGPARRPARRERSSAGAYELHERIEHDPRQTGGAGADRRRPGKQ